MISFLRRPVTWVWALAVVVAILVGLAIGGLPDTATDVPLKDRKVTSS
ncbi:MAG: hypothetical protein WA969_19275 [Candidatus Microthrix parvicella]|jgi:hypothetical protein